MGKGSYVEWRSKQNIRPVVLPGKEKLFFDLMNIEHSWSGRMDSNIGNTFIMEANQLLINSIELFEMGYFDCAYFSLRSAIDISTTMVFLCDIEDSEKEKYLEKWKKLETFPQRYQMIKKLALNGDTFSDMYNNMPTFFEEAEQLSQKLNKYVHKQGLRNFYISRNHPIYMVKSQEEFISNFLFLLKKVIGVVAVMRLAIDPFPILLMDEEILYRCFDSMTDPYSERFVKEYIGQTTIQEYKRTTLYISMHDYFMQNEKKNDAVFKVVKHQYIVTARYKDISSQFHLMTKDDIIATQIACKCNKIVKVYAMGGILTYFTDRNTNRKKMSWSSMQFEEFSQSNQKYNQQFDEAYISVFKVGEENYYAEHNELLENSEIAFIETIIKPLEENNE